MAQTESDKSINTDIIIYSSPQGDVHVNVLFEDETAWLTQKAMAELFDVGVNTINYHLGQVFASGELEEESVIRKIRITAADGKAYLTSIYNLDAIISVGYRVNSAKATQFRIWATHTLREYIIKGFVLDDERLANGSRFGPDYFEELLERVREIRASERRFYQKITDIYATCSADYDPNAEITRTFYATVQNKLHWAITGQTAAEIIADRANAEKPHMGLTTWKQAPDGKILKSDTTIAKNYLSQNELSELLRIVNLYLDYAELQAQRHRLMAMKDWAERLDAFLAFNEYDILHDAGRISANVARELAEEQYDRFRVRQDREYLSDFDHATDHYLKQQPPAAKDNA